MSLMSSWYFFTKKLGLPIYKLSDPKLINNHFNKAAMSNWLEECQYHAKVLELSADDAPFDKKTIGSQYRKLNLKYHPDKCDPDEVCQEHLYKIQESKKFFNDGERININSNLDIKEAKNFLIENYESVAIKFNNYLHHNNEVLFPFSNFNVEKDGDLLGEVFYDHGIYCE